MNKWATKEFGKPKTNWKKIITILSAVIIIGLFSYSITNYSSVFDSKSLLERYPSPNMFEIKGIGDSTGMQYYHQGENCYLQYKIYDFQTDEDAKLQKDHSSLMGSGFLESRKTNVVTWANYSRMDVVTKTGVGKITRLVIWNNDKIYNIETTCDEDLTKVAKELTNN